MEWLACINKAISLIERNLLKKNCSDLIFKEIYMSPMIFSKGFQIITGYSVSTYIRNRRLYLAAKELKDTERKIIDIALDYGFDTPESFTKAFTRFHGSNPTEVRHGSKFNIFLPLKINVSVSGGDQIKCQIKHIGKIQIEGYVKEFLSDTAHEEIPKFFDEVLQKDKSAGEFALCIDDMVKGKFHYMIGKKVEQKSESASLKVYELPERDWAVFECVGENPKAIQELDVKIWKEWLPGNPEYELDGKINVEWYGPNLKSEIWLPIKRELK